MTSTMERPGSQYCPEDTEFSLPEGVDLVGVETSRSKPVQYQRKKPPSWKAAVKLVVINLFVCVLVLGYALIGSFVFLALENHRNVGSSIQVSASMSPDRRGTNLTTAILNSLQTEQIQQLKSDTVRNIWDITLNMNILYPDNWTKMTSEEVGNFQRTLVERIVTVVENATVQEVPYPWNFPRAFLFALTTLTTIGKHETNNFSIFILLSQNTILLLLPSDFYSTHRTQAILIKTQMYQNSPKNPECINPFKVPRSFH